MKTTTVVEKALYIVQEMIENDIKLWRLQLNETLKEFVVNDEEEKWKAMARINMELEVSKILTKRFSMVKAMVDAAYGDVLECSANNRKDGNDV